MNTPVAPCSRLSTRLGIQLYVKHDEVFPFAGGGNKARKMMALVEHYGRQEADAIVTTGGAQSNHARVAALAAAERGWKCRLILHGDGSALRKPTGNLLLMLLAGAEISVVHPDDISEKLSFAAEELKNEGCNPCAIPGGGHSPVGCAAYLHASQELALQCEEIGWFPDWLIVASGTGSTQAGLIVGMDELGWSTRVIGVSVARENPRGEECVALAVSELRNHLGLPGSSHVEVEFRDEWTAGGYESTDKETLSAIRMAATTEGLVLDPTYTGKAFRGLVDMVRSGEVPTDANVLFWHTGGMLNLMAAQEAVKGKLVQG